MRTLEEIRKQNGRKNMFFEGMEEKPAELTHEEYKEGREFFENFIQPTSKRVWKRQLANGNLD